MISTALFSMKARNPSSRPKRLPPALMGVTVASLIYL